MTTEPGQEGPLELAARRLERAVALLEQRVTAKLSQAGGAGADFESHRSKLAAALDESRARERDLVEAGGVASEALARAIAEIRGALGPLAGE
jgi:multidrug resistance efflux pump